MNFLVTTLPANSYLSGSLMNSASGNSSMMNLMMANSGMMNSCTVNNIGNMQLSIGAINQQMPMNQMMQARYFNSFEFFVFSSTLNYRSMVRF